MNRPVIIFLILLLQPILIFAVPPIPRVVSLSPATTEMLFDLKLGHLIVGTTQYSDTSQATQPIQVIGAYQRPNLEMILLLQPTLVIGVKEGVDTVSATLKKAKIPLLTLNTQSLTDFENNMAILGRTFSVPDRASRLIAKWKNHWAEIPPVQKRVKVIIQIDQNPLMLVGQQTYLNEIIERCGAENLFQQTGYRHVSREVVAQMQPDKILTFTKFANITKQKIIDYWQAYPAFKKTQVQFFNPDYISRLTFRLSQMAPQICAHIRERSS